MAVPVTHVESVSPELVLIDPRLAIDARARLSDPTTRWPGSSPISLPRSRKRRPLRFVGSPSSRRSRSFPPAGGATACRSSLRRSRPGARPRSSSPMCSSMTGLPGWSSCNPPNGSGAPLRGHLSAHVSLSSVQAAFAELSVPALGAEDVEVAGSVCFSVPLIERVLVRTWRAIAFRAAVALVGFAEELFCRPKAQGSPPAASLAS